MRPETLQSLSVAAICIGLFLTALGGFGAFYFGQRAPDTDEAQRTATVQTLAEIVSTMREEQRDLLDRVAAVELKTVTPLPSQIAGVAPNSEPSGNPLPSIFASAASPPAMLPSAPLELAPATLSTMPDLLRPHSSAATHASPSALAPEQGTPALPPKLPFSSGSSSKSAPAAPAATADLEEPLSGPRRAKLVARLRDHPRQILIIRAAAGNPAALKLAITLKSVFREAGWNVGEIETVARHLPAHTLLLSTGDFPPPKEFVAAYAALAGIGFLVTSDLDPHQGRKRVVISVGPIP